jgi:hypothetical protein
VEIKHCRYSILARRHRYLQEKGGIAWVSVETWFAPQLADYDTLRSEALRSEAQECVVDFIHL